MKQTILCILLLACVSMHAQNVTPRHEISIGYGYPTVAFAMNQDCDPTCPYMTDASYVNKRDFGPLSVEYFYRTSRVVSIGGVFTLINRKRDISFHQDIGDYNQRIYGLMPAIKFNWVSTKHFGFYTKLVAGPCMSVTTDKIYSDKYTKREFGIFGQYTPIGIEAGGRLRVYGELGIGLQSILSGGLRYKF